MIFLIMASSPSNRTRKKRIFAIIKQMKQKLIYGGVSLVAGFALFFMGLNTDPQVSADVGAIDPNATIKFEIVLFAGVALVIISFILFAMAAVQRDKKD